MNKICKEIFRAIHEGKWLNIEYRNKDEQVTKYWIGIKDIDARNRTLNVDGLHLAYYTVAPLTIYIDSILSAEVVQGTYFPINEILIDDVKNNSSKYLNIFSNVMNLKILNYLSDCNKLNRTPYKTDYSLLKENFDEDCLINGPYKLSDNQFKQIVREFHFRAENKEKTTKIRDLCVNVISINSKKGIYVLAYRKLLLNVVSKTFVPEQHVTFCHEFTINDNKDKLSIQFFLDADDLDLIDNFEENREIIKDRIKDHNPSISVDDMPYLMALGYDARVDLDEEYSAILKMIEEDNTTVPIQAFFGELVSHSQRRKEYPVALLNDKVNLDQLLAINTAMKFPLTYVQGPPGTGKTNTIINTISTAFFNEKTILFASYNNHPIDSVFKELSSLKYKDNLIPFPILRLGNKEKIQEAIRYIKTLYENVKNINIFASTLDKNKDEKIERSKQLSLLLKKHEEKLDYEERREIIKKILSSTSDFTFSVDLESRQLRDVEEHLQEIGVVSDEDAMSLLSNDFEEYFKWLYYTSAQYIQRLSETKYDEFWKILNMNDENKQVAEFNKYMSLEENVGNLLRVFPIIVTTCISAHRIGKPMPYFDITIIDEASQCNTAESLIPIIRGRNLMLVGDQQQLNPVILLDKKNNDALKKKYSIAPEYDFINNSIYKTYLACDAISDEILLSNHYRCHEKIIDFNNKKYYNNKLNIKSKNPESQPLTYVNVNNDTTSVRNTAPEECEQIVKYCVANKDKKIGIITPFVNQKNLINEELQKEGITDVVCGTVHAFQGDEKDIILCSLAITDKTTAKTYNWLKGNKELINVAVSRAKNKFILLTNDKDLERLHSLDSGDDDIYELASYMKSNGTSRVTSRVVNSRALGIKPYSTETEDSFMNTLTYALGNINIGKRQYEIRKEVPIAQVFGENFSHTDLFYTGRFDFVVFEKKSRIPVFAIELDGKEHYDNEVVKIRDEKKKKICDEHRFQLIRVDNSYARRYAYIKGILIKYLKSI